MKERNGTPRMRWNSCSLRMIQSYSAQFCLLLFLIAPLQGEELRYRIKDANLEGVSPATGAKTYQKKILIGSAYPELTARADSKFLLQDLGTVSIGLAQPHPEPIFLVLQELPHEISLFNGDPLWLIMPGRSPLLLSRHAYSGACLSPTAKKITFSDAKGIRVIDLSGNDLLDEPMKDASVPIWCSDDWVAFTMVDERPGLSAMFANKHIGLLDLRTRKVKQLTEGPYEEGVVTYDAPRNRILMQSTRSESWNLLWQLGMDGGVPVPLTSPSDYPQCSPEYGYREWSPDWSFFVYDTIDAAGSPVVWLLRFNADGNITEAKSLGAGALSLPAISGQTVYLFRDDQLTAVQVIQ